MRTSCIIPASLHAPTTSPRTWGSPLFKKLVTTPVYKLHRGDQPSNCFTYTDTSVVRQTQDSIVSFWNDIFVRNDAWELQYRIPLWVQYRTTLQCCIRRGCHSPYPRRVMKYAGSGGDDFRGRGWQESSKYILNMITSDYKHARLPGCCRSQLNNC